MSNVSFIEAARSLSDETVKDMISKLAAAIDARADDEMKRNPDNTRIQTTLKSIRAGFTKTSVARFCTAANVPENFINRSLRSSSKYNVYAAQKLQNIAQKVMLGDDVRWNDINRCIIASMFKCEKAGIEFSHKVAVACTSKQIACDANVSKHLVRHTVAPTTSTTQASSTMQALQTAGVVAKYENEAGAECYRFTENTIVSQLREMFSK